MLFKLAMLIIDSTIKSSVAFRVAVFFLFLLIHVALSYLYLTFNWLASFGGMVTVVGFIFIFGYSFPESEPIEPTNPVSESDGQYVVHTKGMFSEIVPEKVANEIIRDYQHKLNMHQLYLESKRKHLFLSFYITIIGTLTWAYAGYLDYACFK